MPQLILDDIHFAYPDGNNVLEGLSLRAEAGESIGLVGANGAGKSTLLLLLMGILWPQKGRIEVLGQALDKRTVQQIRRQVGLVFQDSDDQLFCATVGEDVAFGPRNAGLDAAAVEQAVVSALEQTGVTALRDRAPYKLSGGEKRLAAISSVLSMDPAILIMDEPSSSLDPRARRNLIGLLRRLPQTKLITSHDLDLVWDVCDRVIVLQGGRAIADGAAKTVLSDEALLQSAGLELPLRLQHVEH